MARLWVLYGTCMDLVPWIAGNLRLGHQSIESTGHALFLDTSKCTMKAWRKTTPSDVRVSCYASSHIFLFLVLRRTIPLFFQMLPRKEPEEVFLVFPSIFSKFHDQILHLLVLPSDFLKSHYLIEGKNKQTNKKLHLFQLLFQAISLHDSFLAVMNKCYYLCFSI